MPLSLPSTILPDTAVWGFLSGFDDAEVVRGTPREAERFGDAPHPIPDGRPLAEIVRECCREANVCQPFIWAKLIGETSFLSAHVPPGKGYKAPMGFDCPDTGRDPRPEYLGVLRNIRGAVEWWGTFRSRWDWRRRLRDGVERVNASPEGQPPVYESVRVRTAAEVAYLIYTPHLYSLHHFLAIVRQRFPFLVRVIGPSVAELKVVILPGYDNVPDCHPRVEGGVTRVDLRPFAEALACEVNAAHIADQGKVYVRPPQRAGS